MNNAEVVPAYSMDDLAWIGVREFQSVGTGKFYKSSNGKMKEETKGVEFVNTIGAGRMTLEEWYAAMEDTVIREEKAAVLAAKIEAAESCAWLRTDQEKRQYALEGLMLEVRHGKRNHG